LNAEVSKLTLGMKQLDGDDAEDGVRIVARNVSKTAAGKTDVAIGEVEMHLGLARNGAGDTGGADGDKEIIVVVLMEKRGVMRRDFDAVYLHILIRKEEVVTRLRRERHSRRRLPTGMHSTRKEKRYNQRRLHLHSKPSILGESLA
jgi:hypothetical protein